MSFSPSIVCCVAVQTRRNSTLALSGAAGDRIERISYGWGRPHLFWIRDPWLAHAFPIIVTSPLALYTQHGAVVDCATMLSRNRGILGRCVILHHDRAKYKQITGDRSRCWLDKRPGLTLHFLFVFASSHISDSYACMKEVRDLLTISLLHMSTLFRRILHPSGTFLLSVLTHVLSLSSFTGNLSLESLSLYPFYPSLWNLSFLPIHFVFSPSLLIFSCFLQSHSFKF